MTEGCQRRPGNLLMQAQGCFEEHQHTSPQNVSRDPLRLRTSDLTVAWGSTGRSCCLGTCLDLAHNSYNQLCGFSCLSALGKWRLLRVTRNATPGFCPIWVPYSFIWARPKVPLFGLALPLLHDFSSLSPFFDVWARFRPRSTIVFLTGTVIQKTSVLGPLYYYLLF